MHKPIIVGGFVLTRRYSSEESKHRILSACAKLFIEKGYSNTTVSEILKAADVTSSTFQNIFRSKDGVLVEFVRVMFENQFNTAKKFVTAGMEHVFIYEVEVSIQLALTEINDNLRDIYVEAYTYPETLNMIQQKTTNEVKNIFLPYVPHFTESDFFEVEIGLSGIMRNYMARKCDMYFTLEKKIKKFINMSLRLYDVPKNVQKEVIDHVMSIDINTVAGEVMNNLFKSLAMKYELTE